MKEEVRKDNTIASILKDAFDDARRSAEFRRKVNTRLTVFVLERDGKSLAYVTDGIHTILALSNNRKEEVILYPRFVNKTPFYHCDKKVHWYLNFTADHPKPDYDEIHPYSPHFFMKEEYSDFLERRKMFKWPTPCEVMELQSF